MKDPSAILPIGSNLSTLSTSNVSDDGMEKPAPSSRDHGGLSSSRGHNERPKLNSSTQSESQQSVNTVRRDIRTFAVLFSVY